MAERSKAPDSRSLNLPIKKWGRAFWSPNGGVGSNPTPDNIFFSNPRLYFLCVLIISKLLAFSKDNRLLK